MTVTYILFNNNMNSISVTLRKNTNVIYNKVIKVEVQLNYI